MPRQQRSSSRRPAVRTYDPAPRQQDGDQLTLLAGMPAFGMAAVRDRLFTAPQGGEEVDAHEEFDADVEMGHEASGVDEESHPMSDIDEEILELPDIDEEMHAHLDGTLADTEDEDRSRKRPREEDDDDHEHVKLRRTESRTDVAEARAALAESSSKKPRAYRTFRPLTRPDRPGDAGPKETGLEQPVHRFRRVGTKARTWKRPSGWKKRVENAELPEVTATPGSRSVDGLRKFDAPTLALDGAFASQGLEKSGGQPSGFRPKGDDMKTELVRQAGHEGMRAPQVLMQLSEVLRGKIGEKSATEVQFGYGMREDDELDLFASANESAAQEELLALLADPGATLRSVALGKNDRLAKKAGKLLFFEGQQAKRRAALEAAYEDVPEEAEEGESEETTERREERATMRAELDLARRIWKKALSGDVTVVKNDRERHAEQNIADVLADGATGEHPYTLGDIQGTKLRCGACTGALGRGTERPDGTSISGNIWPAHTSSREMGALLTHVKAGDHRFSTSTRRYDSDSSVAEESDEEVTTKPRPKRGADGDAEGGAERGAKRTKGGSKRR